MLLDLNVINLNTVTYYFHWPTVIMEITFTVGCHACKIDRRTPIFKHIFCSIFIDPSNTSSFEEFNFIVHSFSAWRIFEMSIKVYHELKD